MLRGLSRCVCGPILVLLLTIPALCSADCPEEPVGTWALKSFCPDGKTRSCLVILFKEESELKANYVSEGESRPAKAVLFERGILTLRVDGRYGGQTYGLTYKGKPAQGKIKGTVTWSYQWFSGSFLFEGEHVEQAV